MMRILMITVLNIVFYWILIPYSLVLLGRFLDGIFQASLSPEFSLVLGLPMFILGISISICATAYFITDGLGLPISGLSPKKLVKCGPYSFLRHPVYSGFILFTLGLTILKRSIWGLILSIVLSISIVLYAVIFEERKLMKIYGVEYEEYRKKVGSFIPRGRYGYENCPPPLFVFFYIFGHIIMPFFYKVEIERRCEVPLKEVVLVSNHVSYLDFAFLLYAVKGYARFPVSSQHFRKHEMFYRSVGCFPIKRYEPDMKAIKNMMKILNEGGRIGIFPEAERSWDGRFLGFKEGFDKLLSKFPKPYVGVRLEKVHLYFPRWSKRFRSGRIKVVVEKFEDVRKLEEFLSKPSVDMNDTYPSYDGVEYYLYLCPKCGGVMSIRGSKEGIRCEKCDFKISKPTVGELWDLHDEMKKHLSLPIEDEVIMLDEIGRRMDGSKVTLDSSGILTLREEKIDVRNLKSMIVEGVRDVYLLEGGRLLGFRLLKTSALMWQEVISDLMSSKTSSFQTR